MARPPLNAQKQAASRAPALRRWPASPGSFSPAEVDAWKRLGQAAMAAGTLTDADLLAAETTARLMARLAACYSDPTVKATTVGSLSRLVKECLSALGLTPASRKSVEALPVPKSAGDPLDEF